MTNFIVADKGDGLLCTRCGFRGDEGLVFRQTCDCGGERYIAPAGCIVIREEPPKPDIHKIVTGILRDLQCAAE